MCWEYYSVNSTRRCEILSLVNKEIKEDDYVIQFYSTDSPPLDNKTYHQLT